MGDEALVRWLLHQGANPNLGEPSPAKNDDPNAYQQSGDALNEAARQSSIEIVDLLLEHGAVLSNSVALHAAAGSQNSDAERVPMLSHLLDLGLDVNVIDESQGIYSRGTPLWYAVSAGMIERARFLMKNGADPHRKGGWPASPFDEAEAHGMADFLELFRENPV